MELPTKDNTLDISLSEEKKDEPVIVLECKSSSITHEKEAHSDDGDDVLAGPIIHHLEKTTLMPEGSLRIPSEIARKEPDALAQVLDVMNQPAKSAGFIAPLPPAVGTTTALHRLPQHLPAYPVRTTPVIQPHVICPVPSNPEPVVLDGEELNTKNMNSSSNIDSCPTILDQENSNNSFEADSSTMPNVVPVSISPESENWSQIPVTSSCSDSSTLQQQCTQLAEMPYSSDLNTIQQNVVEHGDVSQSLPDSTTSTEKLSKVRNKNSKDKKVNSTPKRHEKVNVKPKQDVAECRCEAGNELLKRKWVAKDKTKGKIQEVQEKVDDKVQEKTLGMIQDNLKEKKTEEMVHANLQDKTQGMTQQIAEERMQNKKPENLPDKTQVVTQEIAEERMQDKNTDDLPDKTQDMMQETHDKTTDKKEDVHYHCRHCDKMCSYLRASIIRHEVMVHGIRHIGIKFFECPACPVLNMHRSEYVRHLQSHVRRGIREKEIEDEIQRKLESFKKVEIKIERQSNTTMKKNNEDTLNPIEHQSFSSDNSSTDKHNIEKRDKGLEEQNLKKPDNDSSTSERTANSEVLLTYSENSSSTLGYTSSIIQSAKLKMESGASAVKKKQPKNSQKKYDGFKVMFSFNEHLNK